MRVISGKYRGKKLNFSENKEIRPTSDMVKQAMFTKLQFRIPGCNFLDLFGGSGQIAVEAISRGANVVVCDKSKSALKLIRENTASLSEKPRIIEGDFTCTLNTLKGEKFDIIFIDPPYDKHDIYQYCLDFIYENNMLKTDGYVICELSSDYDISSNYFKIETIKSYGIKNLVYFTRASD